MWKLLYLEKPANIHKKLDIERQEMTIRITEPRIQLTEQDFLLRASRKWNTIPENHCL